MAETVRSERVAFVGALFPTNTEEFTIMTGLDVPTPEEFESACKKLTKECAKSFKADSWAQRGGVCDDVPLRRIFGQISQSSGVPGNGCHYRESCFTSGYYDEAHNVLPIMGMTMTESVEFSKLTGLIAACSKHYDDVVDQARGPGALEGRYLPVWENDMFMLVVDMNNNVYFEKIAAGECIRSPGENFTVVMHQVLTNITLRTRRGRIDLIDIESHPIIDYKKRPFYKEWMEDKDEAMAENLDVTASVLGLTDRWRMAKFPNFNPDNKAISDINWKKDTRDRLITAAAQAEANAVGAMDEEGKAEHAARKAELRNWKWGGGGDDDDYVKGVARDETERRRLRKEKEEELALLRKEKETEKAAKEAQQETEKAAKVAKKEAEKAAKVNASQFALAFLSFSAKEKENATKKANSALRLIIHAATGDLETLAAAIMANAHASEELLTEAIAMRDKINNELVTSYLGSLKPAKKAACEAKIQARAAEVTATEERKVVWEAEKATEVAAAVARIRAEKLPPEEEKIRLYKASKLQPTNERREAVKRGFRPR